MIRGLRLLSNRNGNEETLQLKAYQTRKAYSAEGILSVTQKVYEDASYKLVLDADEEYRSASVYINGEELESIIISNEISFNVNHNKATIFANMLGVAQISVKVAGTNGEEIIYYSDYVSIMIRNTDKYRNVTRMVDFVYRNQTDLLTKRMELPNGKAETKRSGADFDSQIRLLEDILNIYELQYGYFKVNSRSKLKSEEVVDGVEKLQNINLRTIQYMIQHPEYLRRSLRGIRHGKQEYLPNKTMMVKNCKSRDIYENQVIMAFLRKIMVDTKNLRRNLEEYLSRTNLSQYQELGYLVSLKVIYLSAEHAMREYLAKISVIESRLKKIYVAYSEILDVRTIDCPTCPKATSVFTSVPQYKNVYGCIFKWYNKSGFNFEKEQNMLLFTNIPEIYEIYTLSKMVSSIKSQGYVMTDSKSFNYPTKSSWQYKNKPYNNTFEFKKNNQILVLYYEPIIYDNHAGAVNNIRLYRNNTVSMSLNQDREDEIRGHYYVPDYIIKSVSNDRERYAICDAKYSNLERVRGGLIPQLTYKYLISLSPGDDKSTIESLNVLYGLHDYQLDPIDFYDNRGPHIIKPSIRIVPCSENVSEEKMTESIRAIVDELTWP